MSDPIRDQIEDILLARLDFGSIKFGPWQVPYERKHTKEALGEAIDLSIYISRLLVQWDATLSILDEVAQKAAARATLGEDKQMAVSKELAAEWEALVEAISAAI